jgi:S1-C subfamily serine protease
VIVSNILTRFNDELAAVSELTLRSLVRIRNGRQGVGSGTIWHADGLIITNNHVIAGDRWLHTVSDQLAVVLSDGRELPATVLAHNPDYDLAALRVQATDLPTIALGDSRQLQAGQMVLALGFPWGVTGGATTGVVIGVGANLPELRESGREWLAASLHLRPGHSGGPMIDTQGRLVGINTMMNGPDVGVAVPVHVAKAFLKQAYDHQVQGRTIRV